MGWTFRPAVPNVSDPMVEGETHQVITTVGVDRRGLVGELSALILEAGGNVEDSRMVALGGSFACMVLVTGDADALRSIRERLPAFAKDKRLTYTCEPTTSAASRPEGTRYALDVSGLDHRGIVRQVATALTQLEVNIDTLDTRLVPGPMSGQPTFELVAQVTAPPSLPLETLRARLDEVCEIENLDLDLRKV